MSGAAVLTIQVLIEEFRLSIWQVRIISSFWYSARLSESFLIEKSGVNEILLIAFQLVFETVYDIKLYVWACTD